MSDTMQAQMLIEASLQKLQHIQTSLQQGCELPDWWVAKLTGAHAYLDVLCAAVYEIVEEQEEEEEQMDSEEMTESEEDSSPEAITEDISDMLPPSYRMMSNAP